MSEPSDSSEYNGISVYFHSIDEGDFGTDVKAAPNGDPSANYGDLADLIVDSLPKLEYRIGPLDMVQVVVWEPPELTSPMGQYQPAGQKVTTDGKLFYPYAGELQAAGLTAQELRIEITKRLSDKILNDPQVDVRVSEYNSLKAVVSGEVKNPGYAFFSEAPMTIPMAIAEVGGFNQYAAPAGPENGVQRLRLIIQAERFGDGIHLTKGGKHADHSPEDRCTAEGFCRAVAGPCRQIGHERRVDSGKQVIEDRQRRASCIRRDEL